MDSFTTMAQAFVQQRFPHGVTAAFLGGSAATGTARASSDLDVVVVLGPPWQDVAYVETSRFENRLVEAFVYGADGLQRWRLQTRAKGRPVVDRLIAQGVVLIDTPQARQLQVSCQRALGDGPPPLDEHDLEQEVYTLSSLVDDLTDASDPGLEFAIASALWRAAAELSLRRNRHWIGSGKWLLRELRAHEDSHGLAAWASDPGRTSAGLIRAVHGVLDECGGYLQEGMLRGHRPAGLHMGPDAGEGLPQPSSPVPGVEPPGRRHGTSWTPGMVRVQVREATLSDVEAIRRIGHETWSATYDFAGDAYVEHGLRTWWSPEAIARDIETTRTFVAVVDGEVVGMGTIDLRLDNPTIWKLYVLPRFHGTGAGHALLTRLLQEPGAGARVELEYTDGNTRAARFYEHHGFVETRREPASVYGWPAAVWMVHALRT